MKQIVANIKRASTRCSCCISNASTRDQQNYVHEHTTGKLLFVFFGFVFRRATYLLDYKLTWSPAPMLSSSRSTCTPAAICGDCWSSANSTLHVLWSNPVCSCFRVCWLVCVWWLCECVLYECMGSWFHEFCLFVMRFGRFGRHKLHNTRIFGRV